MRKTKLPEHCELCDTFDNLNYVNLEYSKHRVCDNCLKWFAVFLFNTIRRYRQIIGLDEIE